MGRCLTMCGRSLLSRWACNSYCGNTIKKSVAIARKRAAHCAKVKNVAIVKRKIVQSAKSNHVTQSTMTIIRWITVVLIVGFFVLLVARFLSGDEDVWLCNEGKWTAHGYPDAPKPTSPCR